MTKLPPKEKVIEAWTAIADSRVRLNDGYALVKSSDDAKTYTIRFSGDYYSSDDNATYWRGYPGYPVIAVLMLQGRLTLDSQEAALWKDINWKSVNTKFRNNYAAAVEEVEKERNINKEVTDAAVAKVMKELETLPIVIKRKLPESKPEGSGN